MKRIISLTLVLAMVLAIMPMTVFATEGTEGLKYKRSDFGTYYIVTDYTGSATVVVIPSTYEDVPVREIADSAFSYCDNITSITIPDSVTTISSIAFIGCSGLTSISIPDSVTTIGEGAFANCSNLEAITVDSENTVYYSVDNCIIETATKTLMSGCKTSVIPTDGSVEVIAPMAFYGCSGLESISIPDSLTKIGDRAFIECNNLKTITVDSRNKVYNSAGNCIIETATKTLIVGCNNSVIPSDGSVTSIASFAFSGCAGLESISIPASVTAIDMSPFIHCDNLETITIDPNNKTYHSTGNCIIETATKTLISGCKTSVIPSDGSVTTIGAAAFADCYGLTGIIIPDSVKTIDDSAFYNCYGLTSITFGNSVTTIGDYAFYYCYGLTTVIIPDSVITIGDFAFCACVNLNNVVFGDSVKTIGNLAFCDCDSLTSITVSDSVKTIGDSAFSRCDVLENATLGNSVTMIGDNAFYACTNLTNVSIPDSITTIAYNAFSWCLSLEYNYFDNAKYLGNETNPYKVLFDTVSTDITSCTVHENTGIICDFAFRGCTSLEILTIGDSVSVIGEDAFAGCNNLKYNYFDNAKYLGSETNPYKVLFKTVSTDITSCDIHDDTGIIHEYAFHGCDSLANIIIPNFVTQIGRNAFEGCDSFTNITIPDSVTTIGRDIFCGCMGLEQVTLSGSITTIPFRAFVFCRNLKSITVPDSVTMIDDYAFDSCSGLVDLTIGKSVTIISEYAFLECESLESITVNTENKVYHSTGNCLINTAAKTLVKGCNTSIIPDDGSVTTIGGNAFNQCYNLKSMFIPASVTKIVEGAFLSNLETITVDSENKNYHVSEGCLIETTTKTLVVGTKGGVIPDDGSVTKIEAFAFNESEKNGSIIIPDSITTIGENAFLNCYNLKNIVIPDSVKTVDYGVFMGFRGDIYCEAESAPLGWDNGWLGWDCDATVHWGADICGEFVYNLSDDQAYYVIYDYVGNSPEVNAPSSYMGKPIKEIGTSAFYDCDNLTSIVIPDSVITIGDSTFSDCDNLTSIVIPDSVITIGDFAFSDCGNITSIVIPDSVITIGDSAFYNCRNLTNVTFGNSVTVIGDSAFSFCYKLLSIDLPNTVTTIGKKAFSWCTQPSSIFIPASVITIGHSAFSGCSFTAITVDSENEIYHSTNNCLIETATKTLVLGCTNSVIPADGSVTAIGPSAFEYCQILKSITIPDPVTTIGSGAFFGCTNLKNVVIPDSLKTIDGVAVFGSCYNLKYTYFGNAKYLGNESNPYHVLVEAASEDVTSCNINRKTKIICGMAFYMCSNLTSVVIPGSVEAVDAWVFSGCGSLTDIYCETESVPLGWNEEWIGWSCDATVHWGYELEFTLGDVDGDETIATADYVFAKRAVMGTYTMTEAEIKASDIDKDGVITTADYVYIKRHVMGTYVIEG